MSDSINEQRCEHGKTADDAHERNGDTCFHPFECFDRCPGPSVVTPPAQDEQPEVRADWQIVRCRKHAWVGCPQCMPVPAAPSVSTDHTDETCVFCARIKANDFDLSGYGAVSFVPLNPVTPGHRLFVPAQHVADARAVGALTAPAALAAKWATRQGEDFNLITSTGPAATQTVFHLHLHYVPRRAGDGLVLPWTDQKRREFDHAVEFYGGY